LRKLLSLALLLAIGIVIASTSVTTVTSVSAQSSTPESGDASGSAESELAEELPPPDLPSSNEEGYIFNLDASTTIDLDAVPREAVIYQLIWKDPSAARAQRIAENLGMDGEVNDRGNGTFDVSDNEGEIYVSAALIQYFLVAPTDDGDLPGDDDAIAFAREWLRTAGLLPNDVNDGRISSRSEETKRVVVEFKPLEPESLVAAYPSAVVTIGPEGVVVESSIRWPQIVRADLYQLRDAKDAWQEVKSGQAFLEVSIPDGVADSQGNVNGEVTYTDIDIVYTTAGLPGGTQYLEPVYVLTGRLTPENSDESLRIKAYVSAVANTGAPVG
jgi:hypothetical protein